MNLEHLIQNPSKSETYDDVEKTIANQMARFTTAFTNTNDTMDALKTVCALGMDLWKTCGKRVCEDTSMVLSHLVRQKGGIDMMYQFQQISVGAHNNDVCVYLYLALPTINNNVSRNSLKQLCLNTIEEIVTTYPQIPYTNFKSVNTDTIKRLYNEYLENGI